MDICHGKICYHEFSYIIQKKKDFAYVEIRISYLICVKGISFPSAGFRFVNHYGLWLPWLPTESIIPHSA